MKIILCIKCQQEKQHKAKGMCYTCYNKFKSKRWDKQNKEKYLERRKKYLSTEKGNIQRKRNAIQGSKRHIKKYPYKNSARVYGRRKQRNSKCSNCGSTENLHFHHINYEKREGFTVCRRCHYELHRNT